MDCIALQRYVCRRRPLCCPAGHNNLNEVLVLIKAFLGWEFGQSEVPAPSYKSWQTAFQRMSHRTSSGGFFIHWSSFKSPTDYLQDMFGEESVPKIFSGDRITVSVDTRKAVIDVASLEVSLPTFLSNAIKNYWLLIITRWPARRTPPSSRSFKQQWASYTRVLSHFNLISEHLCPTWFLALLVISSWEHHFWRTQIKAN